MQARKGGTAKAMIEGRRVDPRQRRRGSHSWRSSRGDADEGRSAGVGVGVLLADTTAEGEVAWEEAAAAAVSPIVRITGVFDPRGGGGEYGR